MGLGMSSEKKPVDHLAGDHAGGDTPPDLHNPAIAASLRKYWRTNMLIMSMLLAVWAAVGLGCGVLFADYLNHYKLPGTGFPLGFWFAQQGSIATFVVLILIYCVLMNRLDKKHHEELENLRNGGGRS